MKVDCQLSIFEQIAAATLAVFLAKCIGEQDPK
jgi:hypothetical protein